MDGNSISFILKKGSSFLGWINQFDVFYVSHPFFFFLQEDNIYIYI